MKLDIGIASYGSPEKLALTLRTIAQNSTTDYRVFVIDNPHVQSGLVRGVVDQQQSGRLVFVPFSRNLGYAGAVNWLFTNSHSDYIAYCDNDVEILTPGWDAKLCEVLEANPECGWVFPGAGHYGFNNGLYDECLWNAGYCWVMRGEAMAKVGGFDDRLGHHEEVDYMVRMRMAGYTLGCRPDVEVKHHETSTKSPESAARIHAGVVRWMNKWNRYFCGDALKYPNPDPRSGEGYDPRALRYTDWPPCALYMERLILHQYPWLNLHPEVLHLDGCGDMDAIRVLRPTGYYRQRAI